MRLLYTTLVRFSFIFVQWLIGETAGELTDWKSKREGKSTLSKLKGTIKRLHLHSRGYAQGLVSGGYGLSMDISKDATNIIQSRQDYVLFLLSNYDFLDAFVQVST